jgi:two-component system, chemotaxis family, sensor histidine kinase and response regulator WspE
VVSGPGDKVSMLDLFRSELERHSLAFEQGLVSVETCEERIAELVRAAHSLMGAARIVQLDCAARLAHAMEGVLAAVQKSEHHLSASLLDSLRAVNDVFRQLLEYSGEEIPAKIESRREDVERIIQQLVMPPLQRTESHPSAEPDAGPPPSVAIDPSLLELFRTELENHSRVLEEGLVETEAWQDPEIIKSLMRAAHSLKGAARIIGLDSAVKLAHAMEDMLSSAQRGERHLSSEDFDLLLQGTDVFTRLAGHEPVDIPVALEEAAPSIEELTTKFTVPSGSPRPETPPPPAVAVPASPPVAEASAKAHLDKTEAASVRVSVENLNRLSGFAGECLVEVKTLHPLTQTVQRIKQRHTMLGKAIEQALEALRKESEVEARARLEEALEESGWIHSTIPLFQTDLERFSGKLDHLASRMYDEVVASRMRPFSDGLHGFARMVRDLAKSLGKNVRFTTEGETTPVDRDILEKLEAPLTHLLRNALDHGLEMPERRAQTGKSPEGKLTLAARHVAGMLEISVTDDGGGIDLERVRQKIVAKGHATSDMVQKLSEGELLDFLFLPGFSTSRQVTEISGRGVGLDVVQSMARQVGGNVRVESKLGQGTRVALQLPLTLSVLRTMMFEVKEQPYALPLTRIDRVLHIPPADIQVVEDRQYCRFDAQNIGLVGATQVLDLAGSDRPGGDLRVVVLSDRLNRYGLVVDRLIGEHDLVVIPLPARLGKVPNVSAGAILEDGSPVAILDSEDLVRSIDNLLTRGSLMKLGAQKKAEKAKRKRVLVVDDSLTVREVERRLLENRGYEVTVAVDGIDGWNALQTTHFDLVVTDVDMPRMDGIELVKRIKGSAPTASVPVMIVSYKDQDEYRTRGLEAGASYYLTKGSFHDETLVSAVRDLIGETEE